MIIEEIKCRLPIFGRFSRLLFIIRDRKILKITDIHFSMSAPLFFLMAPELSTVLSAKLIRDYKINLF